MLDIDFFETLNFGKKYEAELIKLLHLEGGEQTDSKFYDIEFNGTKYEVKADRMSHRTGNICIEFTSNGMPSGISITEAQIYAYFVIYPNDSYELFLIPTDYIKAQIEEQTYKCILNGGYNKLSRFYLFPLYKFSQFKKNLKN
jgi:hypothetical protein